MRKFTSPFTAQAERQVYLTAEHSTDYEMVQTLLFGKLSGPRPNAICSTQTKATTIFFPTAKQAAHAREWALRCAGEKGRDLTGII